MLRIVCDHNPTVSGGSDRSYPRPISEDGAGRRWRCRLEVHFELGEGQCDGVCKDLVHLSVRECLIKWEGDRETETVVQIPKVGGDLLRLRSRHNMPVIRATGMVVLWGRAWRMTVQVDVDVDVIFVG